MSRVGLLLCVAAITPAAWGDPIAAFNATSATATWGSIIDATVSGPNFTFSITAPYFTFTPIVNAGFPLSNLPSLPLQLANPNGNEPHPTGTVSIGGTTYDVIYQGGGGASFDESVTVPFGPNPVIEIPADLNAFYLVCTPDLCSGPEMEIGSLGINLPGELTFRFSTLQPGGTRLSRSNSR
jgi:hypothetical protein